jgi:hypothetical protein
VLSGQIDKFQLPSAGSCRQHLAKAQLARPEHSFSSLALNGNKFQPCALVVAGNTSEIYGLLSLAKLDVLRWLLFLQPSESPIFRCLVSLKMLQVFNKSLVSITTHRVALVAVHQDDGVKGIEFDINIKNQVKTFVHSVDGFTS